MTPAARILLFTLLVSGTLLAAGAASAHANLDRATPAPGTRFPANALPPEVVLNFTEPLDASFTRVHLLNSAQEKVEAGPFRIGPSQTATLPLPSALPDGVYVLSWRALSSVDGHTTAGAFVYLVGNASAPTEFPEGAAGEDPQTAAETAWRALAMVGLFLLAGVALFALAVTPPTRALALAAAGGGGLAALAALMAGLEYAARIAGPESARDLAAIATALGGTRVGLSWLARAAFAAFGAGAIALLARRAPRAGAAISLGASAGAFLAQALVSHSGGLPYPAIGIALDFVHLAAGAVWLGGLPALAIVLARAEAARRAPIVLAFSAVATWSLAAVMLTGVVLSFAHLGTLANLWATPWGRALAAKLALVGVLLAIGAYNKFVLVPRVERGEARGLGGLARVVRIEAGVALALVLSVAVLTSVSPPTASEGEGGEGILEVSGEGRYGTVFGVRVAPAEPLRPGLHLYEVKLADAEGRPISNANVTLRFTFLDEDIGTSEARLNRSAPGTYRALAGDLALPGGWRVDVVASGRPDALDDRTFFEVRVE